MSNDLDWPSEVGSQPASQGIDLKRVLWGRKWLLLFFAGVGAALGYLQFTKQPPVYQSNARILVVRQTQKLSIQTVGPGMTMQDPLDMHVELMRTPLILNQAVSIGKLDTLESFRGRDAVALVAAGLYVYRSNSAPEILEMTYTSKNKSDCPTVLNAVIEAYKEHIGASQKNASEKVVEFITKAKDMLTDEIATVENELLAFRETATVLFSGDQTKNLPQDRLIGIEGERAALELRQTQLKAELDSFEEALAAGANKEVLLLTAQKLGVRPDGSPANPQQASSVAMLIQPMLELELLKAKFGPLHPEVLTKEREIKVRREFLQQQSGEVVDSKAGPTDLLTLYVDSIRQEIETNKRKLTNLDEKFKEESERARQLAQEEATNVKLVKNRARLDGLYEEVLRQLNETNIVKDNDFLKVEDVVAPSQGYQIAPDQKQYLTAGALLGALVGVALSLLLETTDKSFRSPDDIARQLRLPVVGHIPRLDLERGARVVKDKVLDKSLATYHRPKSRVAEAFRGVRTALLFGAKSKNLRVVQITSPDPGDGKSTLSANTAIALANSGKKVLLIDADLRKPKQHKLFGLTRDTGVSCVLTGKLELSEAVKQIPVPNLDILNAGPRTDHPGELILDPKFEQMLEKAKESYDIIIVDSPPVLAVTDASAIAPLVDGVLLVFRISKRSRPHASQARETMEMIGAKMLGVVVNGLSDQVQYGYSYGSGGSGYGSGSHYGYGRGYYYGADDYYETTAPTASSGAASSKNLPERRRIDNGT